MTTVKMYSPRTKNSECLNDQNVSGSCFMLFPHLIIYSHSHSDSTCPMELCTLTFKGMNTRTSLPRGTGTVGLES